MNIQNFPSTATASDINGGFLSQELSLKDVKDNPDLLASNFEAMFYRILFKEMRASELGDPLLDNNECKQIREMQDEEWAQLFGKQGHLGIKKLINTQLEQIKDPSIIHPGEQEKLQGLLKSNQEITS